MSTKLDSLLSKINLLAEVPSSIAKLESEIGNLAEKAIPDLKRGIGTLTGTVNKFKEDLANNAARIQSQEDEVKIQKEENKKLKEEMGELYRSIEKAMVPAHSQPVTQSDRTKDQRRKNLIIDGVPESQGEDLRAIAKQVIFDTRVPIHEQDLDEVFRLGAKSDSRHKPRPIVMNFTRRHVRDNIYKARSNIKNNPSCSKIWINEDIDQCTRQERADLRAVADLAKEQGLVVRQSADAVSIAGIRYTHSTLHNLPPDLTVQHAYTRETQKGIFFCSENSHLSNFYPAKLKVNGVEYISAEQAYNHTKASRCGQRQIADAILRSTDPRKIKQLGATIQIIPPWDQEKDQQMKEIVLRKYQQNEDIRDKLLNTNHLPLVETTADKYWGAGAGLTSKEIHNGTWKGQNRLGKILQEVRNRLRATERVL